VRDNPLADKAIELLWKLGRVGANNLKRVNLTNKQLPRILLPSVLSALLYLDVCELDARGNEWCSEPSYQDSVILSMGPRFVWLDGEELTDFKRMQASRLDKNEGVRSNMGHFLTRRGGVSSDAVHVELRGRRTTYKRCSRYKQPTFFSPLAFPFVLFCFVSFCVSPPSPPRHFCFVPLCFAAAALLSLSLSNLIGFFIFVR
jgi:hypothetical protein